MAADTVVMIAIDTPNTGSHGSSITTDDRRATCTNRCQFRPQEEHEATVTNGTAKEFYQLGTTDDCGFFPFGDDTSTARKTAFDKIRARIVGTRLATQALGR